MRATFARSGSYYHPAIAHSDGRREIIWGPPLVTRKTAIDYAQWEINERRCRQQKRIKAREDAMQNDEYELVTTEAARRRLDKIRDDLWTLGERVREGQYPNPAPRILEGWPMELCGDELCACSDCGDSSTVCLDVSGIDRDRFVVVPLSYCCGACPVIDGERMTARDGEVIGMLETYINQAFREVY